MTQDKQIAIIGTGFSGLGMGIKLKEAGYDNFVILEQSDDVGGTWHENHYPGAPVTCNLPCTPSRSNRTPTGAACSPSRRKSRPTCATAPKNTT